MKVIFEDSKHKGTSKLFRYAYKNDDMFIYTDGNSSLIDKVTSLASSGETIAVYIDTVPGNKYIKKTYRRLRSLAINHKNIFVFPIVCSEYYIVKAFGDSNIADVNTCINKGNIFKTDSYINNTWTCRNFEKYCKFIMNNYMRSCFKDNGKDIGKFYICSCDCIDCMNTFTLIEKSLRLLMEYPCVPSGSCGANKNTIADAELKNIHKRLVAEFNSFSDQMEKWDTRTDKGETVYFHIDSIY